MAWVLFSAILVSMFTGVAGVADVLRPTYVTFAAETNVEEPAPDTYGAMEGPRKLDPDSLGVKLTAPSAALVDTRTGSVLFSEGSDRIVPIASITKLMTAMVVLDAKPDWDAVVTFQQADEEKEGIPYIVPGERLTVRDTFSTALIGSANNAALALTRSTGLSREEFVGRMNAKAKRLGLMHTSFSDPTGYDAENVSTALEVARLAFHALAYPEIREAMTRSEYVFTSVGGVRHRIPATNVLLSSYMNDGEYAILGGKTGYTEEAGYTLTVRATKGDADAIGVVLGSPTIDDRFSDLKALLEWGFRTFEW